MGTTESNMRTQCCKLPRYSAPTEGLELLHRALNNEPKSADRPLMSAELALQINPELPWIWCERNIKSAFYGRKSKSRLSEEIP
jgi:hypothetical protein